MTQQQSRTFAYTMAHELTADELDAVAGASGRRGGGDRGGFTFCDSKGLFADDIASDLQFP